MSRKPTRASVRATHDAMLSALKDNHGHIPVLRDRILELLAPAIAAARDRGIRPIVLDGTLGAGGHSSAILAAFPDVCIIGVDRDKASLQAATERLASQGTERFLPIHARFDDTAHVLRALANTTEPHADIATRALTEGISGALYDLGVSSMQLDNEERGFAYSMDAPLDMRMDPSHGITAAEVLNTYALSDLETILRRYGEERFARKIARAIVTQRDTQPFTHSGQLVELLYATIPAAARRTGGHPAKRTFQALRVEVNSELDALEAVIPMTAQLLALDGRMIFMSYQSLEDRIVKNALTELTSSRTPPGLPMELPGMEAPFELVRRGAERASEKEKAHNPRAASVRVRVARKCIRTETEHLSPPTSQPVWKDMT